MSDVGRVMARKLDRMSDELRRSERTAVQAGALAVTTEVRQAINRVAPGGRLRGVGKSGGKVGARFDMDSDHQATIKATGALQLIENDTKAHAIQPKGWRGKRAVSYGGQAYASVQHPGTKGKHPFRDGVEAGKSKAEREIRDRTKNAMKRGMRG